MPGGGKEPFMRFIYPCDVFDRRKPDVPYEPEAEVAERLGIEWSVIDYEALVNSSDAARAVQRVAALKGETAVYRGWMLRPEQYLMLYEALQAKGITLVNTPEEYKHAHYLPESYSAIEGLTPRSVW